MYRTVFKESQYEEEIKKSRFIAYISPVATKEEAEDFILSIKEKHKDARHNCSAYIVGETGLIQKYDDDGEPQKTAGPPILEVLKNNDLTNVVCVVTRYFGGILLGAGGLIRAYSSACSGALDENRIIEMKEFIELRLEYDYVYHGVLENYMFNQGFPVVDIDFTDKVGLTTYVFKENLDKFTENINDKTSATHKILWQKEALLPVWSSKLLLSQDSFEQERL